MWHLWESRLQSWSSSADCDALAVAESQCWGNLFLWLSIAELLTVVLNLMFQPNILVPAQCPDFALAWSQLWSPGPLPHLIWSVASSQSWTQLTSSCLSELMRTLNDLVNCRRFSAGHWKDTIGHYYKIGSAWMAMSLKRNKGTHLRILIIWQNEQFKRCIVMCNMN